MLGGIFGLPHRVREALDRLVLNTDHALQLLPIRQLFGWLMILAGVGIAGTPVDVGTVSILAGWGYSPEGFAFVLSGAGGIMIAAPDYRLFVPLMFPLFVYLAAFAEYVSKIGPLGSNTPLVFHIGLVVLGVVANARERRLISLEAENAALKLQLQERGAVNASDVSRGDYNSD